MLYKCIKDVYYGDYLVIIKGSVLNDDYPTDSEGKYKPAIDIDFSRSEYFKPCNSLYKIGEFVKFKRIIDGIDLINYGKINNISYSDDGTIKYDINCFVNIPEEYVIGKAIKYFYITNNGNIDYDFKGRDEKQDKFLIRTGNMYDSAESAKKRYNEIMSD